ncbi:hypothetical protein GWI33_001367 [Rhynchophorus ferrugineus]|uniref:Uncharacterized protein n=1 Tax=Rhynchophorus ferrugineus TaxID=354439 RepID=A0A834IQC0_RHYFE|nr:hypothetical protein GWI33_001367 [Rhynchophorus ferrugineus]
MDTKERDPMKTSAIYGNSDQKCKICDGPTGDEHNNGECGRDFGMAVVRKAERLQRALRWAGLEPVSKIYNPVIDNKEFKLIYSFRNNRATVSSGSGI